MQNMRKSYFLTFSLIVLILISLLIAENFSSKNIAVKADEPKEICKEYKAGVTTLLSEIDANLKNPEDFSKEIKSLEDIAAKPILNDKDIQTVRDIVQKINNEGNSDKYFSTPNSEPTKACEKEIKSCPPNKPTPPAIPMIPMMMPEMPTCPDPVAPKAPVLSPDLSTFAGNVMDKYCQPPNGKGSGNPNNKNAVGVDNACKFGLLLESAIENFNKEPSLENSNNVLRIINKIPVIITLKPESKAAVEKANEDLLTYTDELKKLVPPADPKNNSVCKPTQEQIDKWNSARRKSPIQTKGCKPIYNDCPKWGNGASVMYQGPTKFGIDTGNIDAYMSSVVGYLPGAIPCDPPLNLDAYLAEMQPQADGTTIDSTPDSGYVFTVPATERSCTIVKSLAPCTFVTKAEFDALKSKNISFPFFGLNSNDSGMIIIGASPGQIIDPGKGGDKITIPGNPGQQIGGGITLGTAFTVSGSSVNSNAISYLPDFPLGGPSFDTGAPVVLTVNEPAVFRGNNPPQARVSSIPGMCEIYTKVRGGNGDGGTGPASISPIANLNDVPEGDSFSATLRTVINNKPATISVTISKDADGKYYLPCTGDSNKDGRGGDIQVPSKDPDLAKACKNKPLQVILGYPGICKDGKREVIMANENIPAL